MRCPPGRGVTLRYYLLAVAPTYLTDPATAIYLIRLLSAALAAVFLTVAFGYARRLREAPALPVGFVVAGHADGFLPGRQRQPERPGGCGGRRGITGCSARRFSGRGAPWSFLWQQPSPISPVGLPLVLWAFVLAQIFSRRPGRQGHDGAREG